MQKTNENTAGVIGVISLARDLNQKIGTYVEHYVNENFSYSVLLSNNCAIRMSQEIAYDYEIDPTCITPERIIAVVESFRKIRE